MRHRQNILIGPDGFYGENKCTSWALGTRQSQKAGRRENGLIIEVSRWWPQSSYFLTPAVNVSLWQFVQQIAAQAHLSSFHFPCNIWFGPRFEGSSEHCEEFHFYFPTCHLSAIRSLLRSIFLSQTPPPSGPLDTTDAHRQSSKTDCVLKTRWKKWEFALQWVWKQLLSHLHLSQAARWNCQATSHTLKPLTRASYGQKYRINGMVWSSV